MRRMHGSMNENETLRRELRNQRTELAQQCKEIEKREAQLVVLSEEVEDMCKKLEERDDELDSMINLNNTLIAKERISNHELQEAHQVLIEGLDGFANIRSRPPVGIKRMGELNEKPFRDICIEKFSSTEWEIKSVELCSLWQYKIQDPEWYPYKKVTIDKKLHRRKTCACMDSPTEQWEVNLNAEEVPPWFPEPALGINFARDGMQEND
ncbi:hypothetical protein C5167_021089 [Papaver somniferum]|uniref:Uncharacterized protein n=1 Tax=Papaver somniferum TaxID=3469 RepID=A0A4Y7IUV2_PAPSO|nr:hypothetical protein C5167_021089 [Papaver somniferum]